MDRAKNDLTYNQDLMIKRRRTKINNDTDRFHNRQS